MVLNPPVIDQRQGIRPGPLGLVAPSGAQLPARRAADDRLRQGARCGRAAADRPARGAARGPRTARSASAATAAAICPRSGATSRRACATARCSAWSVDQRAGAGHRHRPAGRGDPGRLPGHHRRDLAADGSLGPTARGVASRSWSPAPGAVDQFVATHPEYLFDVSPEEARLDPTNLHVLLAHVRAAAFELPFDSGDSLSGVPTDDLLGFPRRGGPRPPGRRQPLVLGERELPRVGSVACGSARRRTS